MNGTTGNRVLHPAGVRRWRRTEHLGSAGIAGRSRARSRLAPRRPTGDNDVARTLANLRDARVLAGAHGDVLGQLGRARLPRRRGHARRERRAEQPGGDRPAGRAPARAGLRRVARRRSDDDDEVPARLRGQRALLPGDRLGARHAVVARPSRPSFGTARRSHANHIQLVVPSERCGPVADDRGARATAARRCRPAVALNTASDDPSAASGSVREHSEMAALDRYAQTADTANARLSIADSVLSDMLDQLTTAKTTILAAHGSPPSPPSQRDGAGRRSCRGDSGRVLRRLRARRSTGPISSPGRPRQSRRITKAANGTISAYAGTTTAMAVDIDRHTSVTVSFNGDAIARGSDAATSSRH